MPETDAMILTINGEDVTTFIAEGGYSWERNDIDAPGAGRDMNGTMRRSRVTSKDKLSITCRTLKKSELNMLVYLLKDEIVYVEYLSPDFTDEPRASDFYSSKVTSAVFRFDDFSSEILYDNVKFDLIEV